MVGRPLSTWLSLGVVFLASTAWAQTSDEVADDVQSFLKQDVAEAGIDIAWATSVLQQAAFLPRVVELMNRQPESVWLWPRYRGHLISDRRVRRGKAFLEEHREAFERAEEVYGVPEGIVAAILGIESSYGTNIGGDRMIDVLLTLSFHYPRRATFFRSELVHFLLLCDEEGFDPLEVKGSYGSAMGYGQFIASSYRAYAIDFDGDGQRDLFGNATDAIGSIAAYLAGNGWVRGGDFMVESKPVHRYNRLKRSVTLEKAAQFGIEPKDPSQIPSGESVTPLMYVGDEGVELFLGLSNYRALARYNNSRLYVRAVIELSRAVTMETSESE